MLPSSAPVRSGFSRFSNAACSSIRSVLIDALDAVGGQCTALYPEKPIYDIPAYPAIEAGDLVGRLEAQIEPFAAPRLLGRRVIGLSGQAGAFASPRIAAIRFWRGR